MGLEAEPAMPSQDPDRFGPTATNGKLRPTESAASNTEYLMNMGYDRAYAEVSCRTCSCPSLHCSLAACQRVSDRVELEDDSCSGAPLGPLPVGVLDHNWCITRADKDPHRQGAHGLDGTQ